MQARSVTKNREERFIIGFATSIRGDECPGNYSSCLRIGREAVRRLPFTPGALCGILKTRVNWNSRGPEERISYRTSQGERREKNGMLHPFVLETSLERVTCCDFDRGVNLHRSEASPRPSQVAHSNIVYPSIWFLVQRTPRTRSSKSIRSALAILSSASIDAVRHPFSSNETNTTDKPAFSASFS